MLRQLGSIPRPQTPLHTLSFMSYLIRAKYTITTFKILNLQSLDIILSTHHVLWDWDWSWVAVWSFQSKWIYRFLLISPSLYLYRIMWKRNILDFRAFQRSLIVSLDSLWKWRDWERIMWFCDGAFSSSPPQRFQEVARVDRGDKDLCLLSLLGCLHVYEKGASLFHHHIFSLRISKTTT
jgi:hypothetical protein